MVQRFPSVDPMADQFAFVSPFNYAENTPINAIDLWGLQAVYVNGNLVGYLVQEGQGPTQIAEDLNNNHSNDLANPIVWTDIVYGNLDHFEDVTSGDGKAYDQNNKDYNSNTDLNVGDYLIISDGKEPERTTLRDEISEIDESLERDNKSLDSVNSVLRYLDNNDWDAENRATKEFRNGADGDRMGNGKVGATGGEASNSIWRLNWRRNAENKKGQLKNRVDSLKKVRKKKENEI